MANINIIRVRESMVPRAAEPTVRVLTLQDPILDILALLLGKCVWPSTENVQGREDEEAQHYAVGVGAGVLGGQQCLQTSLPVLDMALDVQLWLDHHDCRNVVFSS